METTTVHYLNRKGITEKFSGMWVQNHAGVVFLHTKASQTFIPWHRVVMIEQFLNTSGMDLHEVHNKQLSNKFRRN